MRQEVHASDVRNLERCERLAWIGMHSPRTEARPGSPAALGTEVHALVRDYAATGQEPPDNTKAGRIARELVPVVDSYAEGYGILGVEVRFSFELNNITWEGEIDMLARDARGLVVVDWKTTSRITNAPDDLIGMVQPAVYATAVARHAGDPVHARWVYVQTKGEHERHSVYGTFPPVAMFPHEASAKRLLRIAAGPEEHAVKNPGACRQYGGCEHAARCWPGLDPLQGLNTR